MTSDETTKSKDATIVGEDDNHGVFTISQKHCSAISNIVSPAGYSTIEALVCIAYAVLIRYEGADKPPSIVLAFASPLQDEQESDTSLQNFDENTSDGEYSTALFPCDVNGHILNLLLSQRLELEKWPVALSYFRRSSPNVYMAFDLPREFNRSSQSKQSAFKISMVLQINGDYTCSVRQSTSCCNKQVTRFQDHFLLLAEEVIGSKNLNLLSVPIQTQEEKKLISEYNTTDKFYEKGDWLMHELFEEKVKQLPDAVAVSCADQILTYKELDEQSNRLSAKILSNMGSACSSRLVGISVDASIDMVIGLYAIMKAGFAYVPLDPSYPEDRLSYMIENSNVSLVLAKKSISGILRNFCKNVLCLEDVLVESANGKEPQKHIVNTDDLAYVIYTSGSTGKPKGVMVSHRNAVNTLLDINDRYSVTERDKILLVASLSFDLSVYDIFGVLAAGGTVVIPVPEVRGVPDPSCWIETMKKHNVTIWDSAPAVLSLLMEFLVSEDETLPLSLRLCILSGDRIPLNLPTQLLGMAPRIQVMSQGGATEGSIWSIYYPIQTVDDDWTTIPYGMPLSNQKYYVLDEFLNPVPTLVVGELFIGGTGVAMGYINNTKITDFRFLPSPFFKGERIYKTGDLGRLNPAGYIEFCGRIDTQVKIRGFRVELSEIESALINQEGVADALAMKVKEKLVAYVIPDPNVRLMEADLQQKIAVQLPSYMVPAFVVFTHSFPVTANGKVDRQALSEVDFGKKTNDNTNSHLLEKSSGTKTASFTEREFLLAETWSKTLNVTLEELSPSSSFFEIGGDSISAMTVVAEVRKKGFRISVQQVLGSPRLCQLAMIAKPVRSVQNGEVQHRSTPFVQLTPAQIWFFAQEFKNPHFWNQSFLLQPRKQIEASQLTSALTKLISQHEMLRCTYSQTSEGKWIQKINDIKTPFLRTKTLEKLDMLNEELDKLKSSLNIHKGPLLAAGLFNVGNVQRIFLTVHHLVVDLVSWRIILEDLERMYEGHQTEMPSMSFQKWSSRLRKTAVPITSDAWPKETEAFPLLVDSGTNLIPTSTYRKTVVSELDHKVTAALVSSANSSFKTNTADFLLASLILAYNESFGLKDLQIDVEAHGREPWSDADDISRTVGWFMTMFPLKLEIYQGFSSDTTMENTLKLVKEKLRNIPKRGMPFWLLKFLKNSDETKVQKSDVLFNYYGRFDQIQTKSALWDLADEYPCGEDEFSAEEKLTHKVVVECSLKEEKLHMKMFYCTDIHRQMTIESWMAKWKENLTNLVLHCTRDDVFGYTPSDFPLLKLSQHHLDELMSTRLAQLDLEAENVSDMYPCTPMQEGFLFSLLKDTSAYAIQRSCTIKGLVDQNKLQASVYKVILRHDILRTRFIADRLNGCMQIVLKTFEPQWTIEDWSDFEENEYTQKEIEYLRYDRHSGFNFSEPMLRFALFRHCNETFRFIISSHHSLVDGQTSSLILQEIILAYNDAVLPDTPSFKEYVREMIDYNMTCYKAEGFWREEMYQLPDRGNLRFLPPENPQTGYAVIHRSTMCGKVGEIQKYAERHEISVAAMICASWAYIINKYSFDPNDVIFGFVVSGRGTSDIENINRLVGVTTNTLPFRVKIHDQHVPEWLHYIHEKLTAILEQEKSSMSDIQKWCGLNSDDRLFETLVSYNTINREIESSLKSTSFDVCDIYDHEFTDYPLTLDIVNTGNAIEIKALYDKNIMDESAVVQTLKQLERAMWWIATASKETRISEFDIVSPEEHLELKNFNPVENYDRQLGHFKGVHQLFEMMVERCSKDHKALVMDDASLTYRELNSAANALASRLRSLGILRGEKVGLLIDRGITMVVAMLGIWKAGGAFVPIDAAQPLDRVLFIFEDCGCQIVLNCSSIDTQKLPQKHTYINLSRHTLPRYKNQSGCNLECVNDVRDLSYMIYTSGTTGRPKGAMVEHRGLINFLMYKPGGVLEVTPQTNVMQYFAVGFDGAVLEVWTTLCHGGCLFIPSGDFTKIMKIVDAVGNTPSTLAILDPIDYSNLKLVFAGGEPCSSVMVKMWGKSRVLLNGYGPTECSIMSHSGRLLPHKRISIGKPLPNTKSYILDSYQRPVPPNMIGELYIGGVNVGRGYHNRPDLTEKAFLENPFDTGRMYKTGDLARWLENGEIQIIGRIDHQVKLRGKRVELEEVKATIERLPGVTQAHVLVQDKQHIVAYVMSSGSLSQANLLSDLKKKLPGFMVPTAIFCMENFPLTANKKIDQKSLPKFEPQTTHCKGVTPSNNLEKIILNGYREVVDPGFNMEDDFFDLGGHSLSAIRLKSLLADNTGLDISMVDVMHFTTPADLSAELSNRMLFPKKKQQTGFIIRKTCPIDADKVITARASCRQEQMCLLYELIPSSPVYNVTVILACHGFLNVEILKKSLRHITTMHGSFRTSFMRSADNSFYQTMTPEKDYDLDFSYYDYAGQSDCSEQKARERLYKEAAKPFVLYSVPLARFVLVKLSNEVHHLGIFMHHSVTDGASFKIIIEQLGECYSLLLNNHQLNISPQRLNYIDYSNWERKLLDDGEMERQLEFWKNNLQNVTTIMDLPRDRARPAIPSYRGATVFFDIPEVVSEKLMKCALECGGTLFTSLVSTFALLIRVYCQADDVVVGAFFSGRHNPGVESLVGYFVNTLPVRVQFKQNSTFKSLLKDVRNLMLDVLDNQDVPFQKILECLNVPRDTSYHPIIQAATVLQEGFANRHFADGLSVDVQTFEQFTAKFDLNLEFVRQDSGKLSGHFVYNTDIFNRSTIQRMSQTLLHLFEVLTTNQDTPFSSLDLLPPCQSALIKSFNRTGDFCKLRMHQQFEQQAELVPHSIAVEEIDRHITYRSLNAACNKLARTLRSFGIVPDAIVGAVFDRNLEFVASVLGIMKSGGAVLSIEAAVPKSRVDLMLEDAGCKVVVTTSKVKSTGVLDSFQGEIVLVDLQKYTTRYESDKFDKNDYANLENVSDARHLAYIVYTSGTTGKPKGVMINHWGCECLIARSCKEYSITHGTRVTHFFNIMFDVAYQEMLMTLTSGATLVQREKNFLNTLKKVDVALMSPSVLACLEPSDFPNIKRVIVAGEILPESVVNKWEKHVELYNEYGPSEITIVCTWGLTNGNSKVTVGKPITNCSVYILDNNLRPVPIGVKGTMYLGGNGVARGYVKRPDLTQQKFIDNPFGEGKLYNSGDLGSWTENGEIIVAGRKDRQVKLRAFRVELDEVEHVMRMQDGISNAASVVKNDVLVGYVTPDIGSAGVFQLKRNLQDKLPRYMVPSVIVPLSEFPVSSSEKIDYKSLPEPSVSDIEILTKKEEILIEIWSEVLQIEPSKIKSSDSFFFLGGDSISAMRVFSQGRKRRLRFTVQQVFQSRSLSQLAHFAKFVGVEKSTIKKNNKEISGNVPFTPIQEWFVNLNLRNRNCFNQSLLLRPLLNVNPTILQNAIHELISHHDILRASYTFKEGGSANQEIQPCDKARTPKLIHTKIDEDRLDDELGKLQNSLDLTSGPLLAIGLFDIVGQRQYLFITIHHLAVDLVSWQIILEDLETLCRGSSLQPKTSSFKEWSELLISDYTPSLNADDWPSLEQSSPLKTDFSKSKESIESASRVLESIELDKNTTNKLLSLRRTHGNDSPSINDVLLTALIVAYYEWTGETSLTVEQEWHGREPWTDKLDLSRTVGWFTAMFPVTLALKNHTDNLLEHLEEIKRRLQRIPNNGMPYGAMRYLKKDNDPRFNQHSDVVFNYHGSATMFSKENSLWDVCTNGNYTYNNQCKYEKITHMLAIECYISEGRLQAVFIFSKDLHKTKTIQSLAQSWKKVTENILESLQLSCTISDMPLKTDDNKVKTMEDTLKVAHISLDDVEDIYACTPLQEGLIFSLLQDKSSYLVQLCLNITGRLDVERFKYAWSIVIKRHTALRTSFIIDSGSHSLIQIVRRQSDPQWEVGSWIDSEETESGFVNLDRAKGFSANGILIRFALMKTSEFIHKFIWTFHHSVVDGWSSPLVLRDVLKVYHAHDLPPATSFRFFVENCKSRDMSAAQTFWSQYLSNLKPMRILTLSTNQGSSESDTKQVLRTFSTKLEVLKKFARENSLTTTSVMYGAWALVLDRYCSSHRKDVVVAVVVASRSADIEGVEDVVGLLLNTLPLRITLPSDERVTIIEWLKTIHENQAAIMAYDYSNLADIRKWSGLPRNQNLLDTLVTYENYPAFENFKDQEIEFSAIHGYEDIDLPLGVLFGDDGEYLMAKFMYDANRVSNELAHQILAHLNILLDEILLSDSSKPVIHAEIDAKHTIVGSPLTDDVTYSLCIKDQHGRSCPNGVIGKLHIQINKDDDVVYTGVLAASQINGDVTIVLDHEVNSIPEELDGIEGLRGCFISETNEGVFAFITSEYPMPSETLQDLKSILGRAHAPVCVLPVHFTVVSKNVLKEVTEVPSEVWQTESKQSWQGNSDVMEMLTDKELMLRDMWAKLLKMNSGDIKLDHSYFDLGGTSISAISLVSMAEKRGLQFSLSDVVQLETLAEIAAVAELKADEGDILVCLSSGDPGKKPIIYIHASDGGVSSFSYVVGQLKKHPVFAFRFLLGSTPFESIPQLASLYVERMKQLDFFYTETPYVLVGYSSGGAIAFEIALQLQKIARRPETLVIIDGSPDLIAKAYTRILKSSEKQMEAHEKWLQNTWNEKGLNEDDLKVGLSLFRETLNIYASYVPSTIYDGDVKLVLATDILTEGPLSETLAELQKQERDYGTQRLCSKPVRVVDVDGDHYTMMRDEKHIIAKTVVE